MTTDVLIIGSGPNGLLLACELALAGVRPIVLERLPGRAEMPKANGLVGRVVQALDYRGLYERLSGGDRPPMPMPDFQFGALPLELSALEDNPMYVLPIPQRRLEELLEERAHELGVEIRRGYELRTLRQTADLVTAEVDGPEGRHELTARFLVGADGGHSTVRKQCGIAFPGVTDRGFVSRNGQVVIDPPFAVAGTGELEVPGLGRLRPGTFTRTEHGMFAFGMFQPGLYRVSAIEWAPTPLEDSTSSRWRSCGSPWAGYSAPTCRCASRTGPRRCAGPPAPTPGRPRTTGRDGCSSSATPPTCTPGSAVPA
jgi:2-polyprenyl-6-methoxyphenol hydroxylase-like FAD-dependent oxidoreductase